MSGRLILHIGTHKTATTHIQRSLASNADRLAEQGVWYPKYDLIDRPKHYAHIGAANAFAGEEKDLTKQDAERFFSAVAAGKGSYDTTILSAESFWRHRDQAAGPDYWSQRRAFIQRLATILPGDTVIAVVLRRQAEFAQSFYQEHVKATRYAKGFAEYRQEFWYHFAYLDQLRAWQSVFPNVVAIRFDDISDGPNTVRHFGGKLGIDLHGIDAAPHANKAWPPDLTIVKRMLNTTSVDRKTLRNEVDRLAGAMAKGMPKRSLFSDPAERQEFQDGFDAANAALRAEFLGDQDVPETLFPSDFDDDVIFGDTLSVPSIAKLVSLTK